MLQNRRTRLPHISTQSSDHCSVCLQHLPLQNVFFSQEWLITKPHRAKMGDTMLELLMYLHCNGNWSDCAFGLHANP